MMRLAAAALAAPILFIAPATAQSVQAKQFGAREAVLQASISPDGKRIAMITPVEGAGAAVLAGPIDGSTPLKPILSSSGKPDRLTGCRWSTETRLICTVFMIQEADAMMLPFSRMVALNADGSELKQLSALSRDVELGGSLSGGDVIDWLPDGAGSAVLMDRNFAEQTSTGRLVTQTRGGLGVERVDTVSLKRSTVEQPRGSAFEYITDGHGAVRIMGVQVATGTGYNASRLTYFYRPPGDRDWKPLSEVSITPKGTEGFIPYAVDRDLNVAYGFDRVEGRGALYKIALDGSMKREIVFQHGAVDVDSLIRIGRSQRVIGVSYATEKRHAEFFDPALKALAGSLSKALPGLPIVAFTDASTDEKTLLLFAGSDTDPGRYYLLDRATKKMAEVSPIRPELAGVKLAEVKSVSYPAADGTMIPGYLTLPIGSEGKSLPAIVLPHGGPGARDEWGFDWLSQFFAARGFAVLQPQFRGSSGYGDAWFQNNGFQSWRIAVGDVNDAGRWLVKQGIAAPGKLAILGWSYGGYAALQSSVLDPDLFKAIVAIAPVTDLETYRDEFKNFTNYNQVEAFVGNGPHLREGSPAQNAERIKAPVLMFHGDRDLNVGVRESRLMESRLKGAGKQVEYVEFEGLDHQLEDSQARAQMLDKSDAFLRAALGLPARP